VRGEGAGDDIGESEDGINILFGIGPQCACRLVRREAGAFMGVEETRVAGWTVGGAPVGLVWRATAPPAAATSIKRLGLSRAASSGSNAPKSRLTRSLSSAR